MKIGTEQVKHEILRKLKKYKASLRDIKYGGFADELAGDIIALLGDDMNHEVKTYARGIGVPEDVLSMCERAEKAFGFDQMNLKEADQLVYIWLIEQDMLGNKIETFATWAKHPDRAQFIRMYRKDTSNIKIDWPRAFSGSIGIPTDYV